MDDSPATSDATKADPDDAAVIIGQLADPDRRLVLAAIELGASRLTDVAAATALPEHRAARALARLVASGLVTADLAVVADRFTAAARATLARPPSREHEGEPADDRKVLDAFVRDGVVVDLPTARAKRRVVLEWLAQRFEPGRHYDEPFVNDVLTAHSATPRTDHATLRRYLVDEGFLDRTGGEYWRSGGIVDGVITPADDARTRR